MLQQKDYNMDDHIFEEGDLQDKLMIDKELVLIHGQYKKQKVIWSATKSKQNSHRIIKTKGDEKHYIIKEEINL